MGFILMGLQIKRIDLLIVFQIFTKPIKEKPNIDLVNSTKCVANKYLTLDRAFSFWYFRLLQSENLGTLIRSPDLINSAQFLRYLSNYTICLYAFSLNLRFRAFGLRIVFEICMFELVKYGRP